MDFEPLGKTLPLKGVEAIDKDALETFAYEFPGREIAVEITTDEFTSLCPYSGLPDFGKLYIVYVPDRLCIELRSLKYYLLSYREVGIFYEHLVNRILEDLVAVCRPLQMKVEVDFTVRGGLKTRATAEWRRETSGED